MHFDFMFMGKEDEPGKLMTTLVVKEKKTKMKMASVVPTKSTGVSIIGRVVAFMKEIGIDAIDVVARSDQEPAVKRLIEEIGRRKGELGGRWMVESSPVGASASNGRVERGIQSMQGQVRVMKSCLQEKWEIDIEADHMIMAWMVEYAAHLLNRFEVGKDGKTAYERCKGKKAKHMGVEFGEGILWRRKPVGGAPDKLGAL